MTDPNGMVPVSQFALNDRLVNYGDGVFSTMHVVDDKVALYERHIGRLIHDALALGLTVSESYLRAAITEALKQQSNGVLKVLVGAGQGGRGYARAESAASSIAISWHQWPAFYSDWQKTGIHLGTVECTLGRQPALAGLKHANRLEQVLIKRQLSQTPFDDCVVTDEHQTVIEASAANIFWCIKGKWHTAALKYAGVNGVMRQFILEHMPAIEVVEHSLTKLQTADAIFLSNALMQIVPVKAFTVNEQTFHCNIEPVHVVRDSLKNAYGGEYGAA